MAWTYWPCDWLVAHPHPPKLWRIIVQDRFKELQEYLTKNYGCWCQYVSNLLKTVL